MTGGPEPVDEELDEEQFLSELDGIVGEGDMDEGWNANMDEMNKTQYMKAQARKTPGDTFKAFGQTMHDKDVLETDGMNELDVQMEGWDRELNNLLNESKSAKTSTITEGVTISTSSGQQGAPDSVSISATDEDAHKLMQLLSNAGLAIGAAMSGSAGGADYADEKYSAHGDIESGHEDVPTMARPREFGMSQNVDAGDCEVIEPYDYDEISSALGSGGSAMSQLRTKLLALEGKGSGAMEMPDGMGFSVQHEEDEPTDTPEAPESYDYEAVQGALEKGGAKAGADKKSSPKKDSSKKADAQKSDESESDEKIEESDDHMARPRGFGVSEQSEEGQPKAPKKIEQKSFKNAKAQDHKKIREDIEIEKTPKNVPFLGFSQFHDPKNSEKPVDHEVTEMDEVQDELEKHHSHEEPKSDSKKHEDSYGDTEVADQEKTLDEKNLNEPEDGEKDKNSFASIYESFMKAMNEDQMPMPKGNGFSIPGEAKEKMEDGPAKVDVEDLDSVLSHLEEKDTYQQDEFEKAFSKLKSMIQSHSGGESKSKSAAPSDEKSESESETSDESSEDEKIDESCERCDECGGIMEDGHQCGIADGPGATGEKYGIMDESEEAEQLDEWSNSMRGNIADESFMADEEYMLNTITGGLNGKKVQHKHGYRNGDNPLAMKESADDLSAWIKLSGIR
jgi:hypothetical protein